MGSSCTLLVVEDDAAIRRGIVDALRYAGYATVECVDGREAVNLALECTPRLVLLDVLLPGRNGFEILGDLRRHDPSLPIIMVTARGAEADRVRGLDGGADDYIVKPFSPRELLARVEAVLRRSPERPPDVVAIRCGSIEIDLARCEARVDGGRPQPLTPREAMILRLLAIHRDRAVGRDELLHRVWGLNPRGLTTRTVDVHIARLREKIGGGERVIATVRARGYALSAEAIVDPRQAVRGEGAP